MNRTICLGLSALFLGLGATPAGAHVGAHVGAGEVSTFWAGLLHPITGLDHLLAACAVGLWATVSGARRPLLLPVVFVAVMMLSAIAAAAGWPLPHAEPAITGTLVALGLLIALAVRASTLFGCMLVALFAIAHGYAHGVEGGAAAPYLAGLIAATGLLHLAGVGAGRLALTIDRPLLARMAGVIVATCGLGLFFLA